MGPFTRLRRTHTRPLQNSPMFCSYPFLGVFSCVFWVIGGPMTCDWDIACEHWAEVTCQKAPASTHLSKGHSPRRIVACQYFSKFQSAVFLFFFQTCEEFSPGSSSVEPSVAQKNNGWSDQKLTYLDLGVQLASLWQLSLVVFHAVTLPICSIWGWFSSCGCV